ATSFAVTDALPTGLTTTALPSGSGFDCSASSSTNVSCSWTGNLTSASPATTAQLTVPVQLSASFTGTTISNTGRVNSTDSAPVVTTVNQPALGIVKAGPTGANEVKNPGESYDY